MRYLNVLFSPKVFNLPLMVSLLSYELSNSFITLLILLLFALIILNEPIVHLFIRKRRTEHEQFEAIHFWATLFLIPILVVPFLWLMYRFGVFHIYSSTKLITQIFLQLFLMVILHDAYFYWTHRMLHLKSFRSIHSIHHQSIDPTIVSSHVFHYVETAINFSFIIWFTLLSRFIFNGLYYVAAVVFVVYTISWNIYGHSKKNLLSAKITKSSLGKLIVWPTYHLEHHRKGTGNFGFVFTFWDTVFQTKINK